MSNKFDYPRDFKGVFIKKEIWLDKSLTAIDKVIFAEIDSLDVGDGCYASNDYLAEFCQCSKTKVSTSISKLIEKGYLYVSKNDGRKRFLKTRLSKNERQTIKKRKPGSQKMKQSNIDDNTLNNIDDNTDMYAFSEDKSSSKGNMYAFQSGDCKAEEPKKESRYIPEDYTEEQLIEHIKEPIVERFKESYGLDEKSEEYKDLLKTIILFYRTYQQKTGKRHRVLSDVAYKRIVTRYMAVPKTTHSYMRYDYDIYSELVPMYFETNYAKDTAYDISHFMSDKIRGNLFERSGLY